MNVLGTPIQAGAVAARAVLISDLHVGDPGGGVLASLAGAVQHARDHADALFVLGDLFDSYVCRAQVRVGVWRDVAQCFSSAAAAGLRIVVMVGNRDFLLGGEFARASGAELVHGGYRAEIGGLDTLLLHGDELCQNDLPYQRAKRWLRHPVTRAIARNLPLALARGAAARARKRSQAVVVQGDQARFLPSERAVATAAATGARRIVFGHIHRRSAGTFGDAEYRVLPAFDEHGGGLLVSHGRCEAVRFGEGGPEAVLEPALACPWSP
ncbi:MAG: UDP-2,3-diacylglucosamine diphosphatase [Planctomycetota bacterium]|nr:UDP-2,3-diacylglucosamine diphosphatase [Planctomycetota bacterium]